MTDQCVAKRFGGRLPDTRSEVGVGRKLVLRVLTLTRLPVLRVPSRLVGPTRDTSSLQPRSSHRPWRQCSSKSESGFRSSPNSGLREADYGRMILGPPHRASG